MPPKLRLYKKNGKPITRITQQETSGSSIINPELEQQFELELCWCIQQLQVALKSNKLNNKQVLDHTKALNTLISSTSPMVKKRQVMRLSFGDYRAKMAIEDKKSRNVSMKVTPVTSNAKSVFVKKSNFSSSENTFRFNFELPKDSDLDNENDIQHRSDKNKKLHFVPSDNTFRFSFVTE